MRIKEGFELKSNSGQSVIVSRSGLNPDFNSTIVLNDTLVFLWNCLIEGEKTKEQLLNLLLDNFEISTVLALSNIDIFVKTLKQNGIIEE